ncbi:OmpA family protein [Acidovorax sp. SUPP1855]|uniref:OmpA family protein n=1 Tax=Acidovorax sp. SUPP1855 TaxID=431774 RepID=UPI0023DE3D6B|nr:OmpA family protein [Acidovorax sp. SUPP1855]GKS84127.1 OmpA family protein [Acidovorax sp. SUPP1855]
MFPRIRKWLCAAIQEAAPSVPQAETIDRLREARIANQLAAEELRKTTCEKERRQALESHSKRLTGYIDTAKTAIPIVAAGYGVLATFLYCFVVIQFFPSGLSVGDNLLFVFVALGFGLLTFVLLGLGGTAFIPLMIFEDAERKNAVEENRQSHAVFWIVGPAFAKAASFLMLWTLYELLPAASASTIQWCFIASAAVALAAGDFMAWCAWKNGTTSIRKGSDWIVLGCCYGFIELLALPWFSALRPHYAIYLLIVPWVAGLLAWMLMSIWTRPPVARQKDTHDETEHPPRTDIPVLARWAGGAALVLLVLAAAIAWPFEHAPARADTTATIWIFWLAAFAFVSLLGAFLAMAFHRPRREAPPPTPDPTPRETQKHAGEPTGLPAIQSAYVLESKLYFSVLVLLVLYGLTLVVDFQLQGQLSSGIFRSLGLRAEQQTLRLQGAALALVRSQADNAGIRLSFCAEPGGAALVAPVDALWHGMGTRSLLRIGTAPQGAKGVDRSTAIEVQSDEVKIVRHALARCHDIEHPLYFRSNSVASVNRMDELTGEVADVLKTMYPPASPDRSGETAWQLDKVLVTGHADPMPLSDAGNQALSERRATCVADSLVRKALGSTPLKATYRLEILGQGARDPSATPCPHEGRTENLAACHERNRRVTVRLIFTRKPSLYGEEKHALFRQGERASVDGEGPAVSCMPPDRPARS